jgi:four helix bundle protein
MENREERAPGQRKPTVPDFKDLVAWRSARNLRATVYTICNRFPKAETFAVASQMRRAAVWVSANIAEGYGRFSYQENIQFCRQSRGSVYELRDHLTSALDAGYITKAEYGEMDAMALSVIKLINGYIRSTRLRKRDAEESR